MYFWKCWRDSRGRFVINLMLVSALCALVIILEAKFGGPVSYQTGNAASGVKNMWATVGRMLLGGLLSLVFLFGALTFGAASIGEEFKEPTLGFLFTRPRPRRFWVWTCWLVGAGELFVITFLGVVGIFGGLIYLSGYVYTWRLLTAVVPLLVGALAVYTMTFLLTAVARSSEKGISCGLGILMIDLLLPVAAYFWHRQLTSIWDFMRAGCAWAAGSPRAFPGWELIAYAALSLAFLFGAQIVLERAEP